MKKHLDMEWEQAEFVDVLFGDFDNGDREYMKLNEHNALIPRLDEFLEGYNVTENNQMNLVFFKDAIGHLCKVARILRSQRGNALLVGVGGSGRRSLARLATYISNMKTFSIEIAKNYREKEWHEDLRTLLKSAGAECNPTTFLFSDTQIVFESFLEDINNILNAGEVPNLFGPDDYEQIVGDLRSKAKQEGKETRDLILQYFVSLCRANLHIVLAFSPVGD
jgi:dynein heavy chain